MFPVVVVARQLSKEETEERARRWKLIFWLMLIPFFLQVVDAILYAYRDLNWPHWFRLSIQVAAPPLMSWLLVRYFWWLVFFVAVISAVVGGVEWLWHLIAN